MNELTKLEDIKAVDVYNGNGLKSIIAKIRQEVESPILDVEKKKDRDLMRSMAANVAKAKVKLDNLGKELTEDWKKQSKAVDYSRKSMREEMDELRDQVRAPLTEFENREKLRVEKLDNFYDSIVNLGRVFDVETDEKHSIETLESNLSKLELIVVDESLQERELDCIKAKARGIDRINSEISAIKAAEQQAKELEAARIAQEKAEQEAREKQIAEEAESRARETAAQQIVKQQQEAEAREKKMAEEAIARELAAKKAIEEEKQKAIEAAKKAEADKLAAINAEKAKQAEIEGQRLAAIKAEEEAKAKREANTKHRKAINNSIVDVLVEKGIDFDDAKTMVTLAAKGLLPNLTINY